MNTGFTLLTLLRTAFFFVFWGYESYENDTKSINSTFKDVSFEVAKRSVVVTLMTS